MCKIWDEMRKFWDENARWFCSFSTSLAMPNRLGRLAGKTPACMSKLVLQPIGLRVRDELDARPLGQNTCVHEQLILQAF